jgi:hypothetical protein
MFRCISVLFISALLAACTSFPNEEDQFVRLVDSWALVGSPVDDARSFLEARGFKVTRSSRGSPWKDRPETLFATRRGGFVSCIVGDREWRVVLSIDQERIVEVRALVFEHCL